MAVSIRSVAQGTMAARSTTAAPRPTCNQGTADSTAFNTPNRSRSGPTEVAPRRRGGSGGTARLRISSVSSIDALRQRVPENPHHQLFKTDPGCLCSHGHQTVVGHTGHGVHLKQPELAVPILHDVDPSPGATAHHPEGIEGQMLQPQFVIRCQTTGNPVPGIVGQVFGVIV